MDPIAVLTLLGSLSWMIPPPWGPILGGISKVLPLVTEGYAALVAVNKADPELLPHLEQVASDLFGGDLNVAARALFAPQQMSATEHRYHGGPKSP